MFDYCPDCAPDSVAINGLCEINPVVFVMMTAIAISAATRVTPRKNRARGTNSIKKATIVRTLVGEDCAVGDPGPFYASTAP